MESSFFDDLLKKHVDQNAVNALVGSLESQITSTTSPSIKIDAPSTLSVASIDKDGSKVVQTAPRSSQQNAATATHSQVNRTAPVNGSVANLQITNSVENIVTSSNANDSNSSTRSPTPNRQIIASTAVLSASGSQVNIAPKNLITNAVPIAPRVPTTIMITHQQAQMLMAQRLAAGTAIVPSNIVGNVRVAGGQVPLAPRFTGPNNVATMQGINMIPGQIPGVQNIVPRYTVTQNQMIANLTNQNQQSPISLLQTIKQEPSTSAHGVSPKSSAVAMQSNQSTQNTIALPPSTLTQVKGNGSPVPGVVTYRFRPATPAAVANTNAANVAIMKESVKKLKEFFHNLISLASGPNQPPEIGRNVRELVQNVMYNKMNEEEFVEKLQLTLKSDPQPNLVPFLKKTLPQLRETLKQQAKPTTTQTTQNVIKIENQPLKVTQGINLNQAAKSQLTSVVSVTGNPKIPTNAIRTSVMQMGGANVRNLTSSQQLILNRNLALQQRQQLIQKQLTAAGGKDISASVKANLTSMAAHGHLITAASAAEKNKAKPAFHYSSAMTSNDDDINDVTCMAGVNLMEESANILSSGSELLASQTRSCKDEAFLSIEPLKRKIETIVKKHLLREVQQDVISVVSHAAEERLRNILERMAVLSLHRVEAHKSTQTFEVVSDVKAQLKVFEQIDEVERKHREAREREMLMKVAKSRSRTEDPEQARLKEKAKQLQQEEEELLRKRAANKTALEAIGPRKKRKLDEALESLSTKHTSEQGSSSSDGSSNSQLQPMRLRTRRITLKDLQFVLEQDKESTKSLLLFKSYLR